MLYMISMISYKNLISYNDVRKNIGIYCINIYYIILYYKYIILYYM